MPPGGLDGKGKGGRFPQVFEQMGSAANANPLIAGADFVQHLKCDNRQESKHVPRLQKILPRCYGLSNRQ